jgi:hypothetical protein
MKDGESMEELPLWRRAPEASNQQHLKRESQGLSFLLVPPEHSTVL